MGSKGRPRPPHERVLDKIVIDAIGCWVFQGGTMKGGYGGIFVRDARRRNGVKRPAHRIVYESEVAAIPEGMTLDHLCRNRRCVNPAHLEVVTSAENVMRGLSVPAKNARKTHCKRGHELTPENTYMRVRASGGRQCRRCRRLWENENRDEINAQKRARRRRARLEGRTAT